MTQIIHPVDLIKQYYPNFYELLLGFPQLKGFLEKDSDFSFDIKTIEILNKAVINNINYRHDFEYMLQKWKESLPEKKAKVGDVYKMDLCGLTHTCKITKIDLDTVWMAFIEGQFDTFDLLDLEYLHSTMCLSKQQFKFLFNIEPEEHEAIPKTIWLNPITSEVQYTKPNDEGFYKYEAAICLNV